MTSPSNSWSPLRVRLDAQAAAIDLSTTIDAALTVLADARRIRRVGSGEAADVVHVIGTLGGGAPATVRRVQTVEHLPLRSNGREPSSSWRRRARGMTLSVSAWMAHGLTAGRLLVTAGVASSMRVHCLPLLSPPCSDPGQATEAQEQQRRATIRRQLGLAPGVRLAVGLPPEHVHPAAVGWRGSLSRRGRPDLATGELRETSGHPGHFGLRLTGRSTPSATGGLGTLLRAVDVYVAADSGLTACSPAMAAVEAGVPVVTVTTDSAQDLVLTGAAGRLAQPRPDAIAESVMALVDDGVCCRRPRLPTTDARRRTADLAHQLLQVYRHVSLEPVTGGVR